MKQSVDSMLKFITSLVGHYGAKEIKDGSRHRKFTNPWGITGSGNYFFIRAGDGQIRFGNSITRSTIMSDAMFVAISDHKTPKPSGNPIDTTYPAAV